MGSRMTAIGRLFRFSTCVGVAAFAFLLSQAAWGKTYELRYGFRPGDSFEVSVNVSAQGMIASPSATSPMTVRGKILRGYRVTRMEPGRVAILEPALDSASFDIAVGTSAFRVFLTPEFMELNGQVIWKKGLERPSVQLLPFLNPVPIRLDPLGRRIGHRGNRQEMRLDEGVVSDAGRHVGADVVTLFAGEREVFPPFAEKPLEGGESWSARVSLGRVPGGRAGLVRDGTYTILEHDTEETTTVEIGAVERVTASDEPALVVHQQFQRPDLTELHPTPTPRSVERERVMFKRFERTMEGKYVFDQERGRPVSADLKGTERIDATTVRRYLDLEDTFSLSYWFDLKLDIQCEYPERGGQ